jgi:hypothetical protein
MQTRPTREQAGKDGNKEILTIQPAKSGWTTVGWLACDTGAATLAIGLGSGSMTLESLGLGLLGLAGFGLVMGELAKIGQYLHWQTNAEYSNIKDFYN